MNRSARVVVASNRAAGGVYPDRTGPVLAEWLRARGYETPEPAVVADGEPVGAQLREAVARGVAVVLTTGGTGLSPTDRTPEVTAEVLDRPVPGLAEALRLAGQPQVPAAMLSRGLAGVAGRTLVVNLPGSTGGVRDGLGVLDGVLDHAVEQVGGADHGQPGGAESVERGAGEIGAEKIGAGENSTGENSAGENSGAEVLRAEVTGEALDTSALAALVEHRAAGAVVTFAGVVRDHDGGRGVHELEYVSHPSAGDVIGEVAAEVARASDGVRALAVQHRVGLLGIGDVALSCAVAAEHRKQGFEACSELVDEVKRRLPVWKRQVFADGAEEWVNCP